MLLHVVLTSRLASSVKKSVCMEVRGNSDADIILRQDYATYEPDILRAVKDRNDAHRLHTRLNLVGVELEFISYEPARPTTQVFAKVIKHEPIDPIQAGEREQPVSSGAEPEVVLSEPGLDGVAGGNTSETGSSSDSSSETGSIYETSSSGDSGNPRRRKKVV